MGGDLGRGHLTRSWGHVTWRRGHSCHVRGVVSPRRFLVLLDKEKKMINDS